VGNGRILREGQFKRLWIQPSAGDAGGAAGAALTAWHKLEAKGRKADDVKDAMKGSLLGPSYTNGEIEEFLKKKDALYVRVNDEILLVRLAEELASGKIVGWFQGRMEFGPRALGARSILGDARNPKMQSVMNLKIKYRESFRPFAPSVLRERVADYFEMDTDSPYMLLVAPVVERRRARLTKEQEALWGIDLLNVPKSDIPAATHVDYSARVQTVHEETNPRYYRLIKAFEAQTGCPLLVNTSFNVRNEPIVCSPEDAYRCFMRSAIDILVLENCLLYKADQKPLEGDTNWQREFEMD
jgi:carbamoyltransferase